MVENEERPGRGKVRLPDGRIMGAFSPEYKAWLAENPEHRKVTKARAKKPAPSQGETVAFEGTPEATGTPSAGGVSEPSAPRPRTKAQAVAEDTSDFQELIAGLYASVASLTGDNVWCLTREEASAIARPASRILARNKHLDRAVKSVTDPVALVVAVAVPTGVRFSLWQQNQRMRKSMGSRTPERPASPERPNAGTPAPPPPPPPATGAAANQEAATLAPDPHLVSVVSNLQMRGDV